MSRTKVYYEEADDIVRTFTHSDGWYTCKSHSIFEMEFGDDNQYEKILMTPELYNQMLESGDFDGHEPG
uniref:hypothetical protein n=1 Tax=Thaumasiovibrio occultus TaxID=1891184 RepID=UPI000B34E54C|nr:hypothetical protein [Thaumasiovibrio occultus]